MDGEPPQEEDFSTIPLVERSTHKNWKARSSAYNDVISQSAKTASDTDPFFRPYLNDPGLSKKWCSDSNAVAQEKGIEAVLAIVTNSGETSAKLRPEIVPAIVEKALGNSRAGTKKKGTELCAMFVEVENTGEGVVENVLVGLGAKSPKAVAGAVACSKELVESFGVQASGNVKPLLKALPKVFAHSDKNVRAEGTGLATALYTYLGPALMPASADIKPVQMTDSQKSFETLDGSGKGAGSGKPQRWTRKAQRDREEAVGGDDDGGDAGGEEEPAVIDPMSLLDPVNVLDSFPGNSMELIASSKWKERLEGFEECNKVLAQPQNGRISDSNIGAYGPLVQTIGTKIQKDANVNVVMEAAKLLEGSARGLGKSFGQFRSSVMTGCSERSKERKANVVEAIGKALDAVFLTTTLSDIVEDVLTALKSKNPQVKAGTSGFLHRSSKVTTEAPGKDHIKPMAEALVGLLTDSAEPVRSAAAECSGTMMKISGERAFNPYVENIPEIQMTKIKEAFATAEIKYRPGGAKKAAPAARAPAAKPVAKAPAVVKKPPAAKPPSPTKPANDDELLQDFAAPPKKAMPARFANRLGKKPTPAASEESSPAPESPKKVKPVEDQLLDEFPDPPKRAMPAKFASRFGKKPAAAASDDARSSATPSPTKAPAARAPAAKPAPKAAPAAGPSKPAPAGKPGAAKASTSSPSEPVKYRYSSDDAMAKAEELIPASYHTKLADSAWKVRLEGADEMVTWVSEGGGEEVESEIMMRFLSKIPGWGEKNFQVSGKIFQVIQLMAEKSASFGKPAASLVIGPLTDKLGDSKSKKPAGEALIAIAEKTSSAFLLAQSYEPMTKQKAPKAQADALAWIKQQVIDFGAAGIPLRESIAFIKNALGSPNASVRSNATALLVQVKIFVGADISGFIEDSNPTLLATINKEFDKVDGQTPPEPTRQQADLKEVAGGKGKGGKGGAADALDDLIPRVELDKLVNQTTVSKDFKSDAWKTRKEAFESLNALLDVKSNQRSKPTMGEIATVSKKAMADTNLSVKMLALGIITKIATGMGQPIEKYCRVLVPAVASVCADQKATTRTAAINTSSAIADAIGSSDPMYSGIGASLESVNPASRSSVLGWVASRLADDPPGPSADLSPLAGPVVTCLEDRNGDVRKAASAMSPFVVGNVGYDACIDKTTNLKPASKATIVPMIQAAAANAPSSSSAAAPPPTPAKAAPAAVATPARSLKAPTAKVTAATPRASVPRPSGIAPPGRSLAMKALGSASSHRPPSATGERPSGIPKSRMMAPRPTSSASSRPAVASPTGRTLPFVTSSPDAKANRLKRDAARWMSEAGARSDTLEYLAHQMEPHTSADIFTSLFSKDHRAEEDFMTGLAVIAEFYDPETAGEFGSPDSELDAIQSANNDLASKYAAIRLMTNHTQVNNRSSEVISNVLDYLTRSGERSTEVEVRLFVPALVMKLGDPKFVPKLTPIFDGSDKIIPASQVVQLSVQYGLEEKGAGKTQKNESLALIEKAFKRRGSVLRKDERGFYEAIAKCIADPGTRPNALNLMALLQLQGESRNSQAVVAGMPTSAKDMLANRRNASSASKGASGIPRPGEAPASPRPGSRASSNASYGTPASSARISRESSSSTSARPQPRGIPTPAASRLPTTTPARGQPRGIPAPSGIPGSIKRPAARSLANDFNGAAAPSRAMQPLGRAAAPPPEPELSEAAMLIDAIYTEDVEEAAEALKATAAVLDEDEEIFIPEARNLINGLCFQSNNLPKDPAALLEPRSSRRMKHLMRTIHITFSKARSVKKVKLEGLETMFAGIRQQYASIEVWSEARGDDNQSANDSRDYMSMVLSSMISTPSREAVYTILFEGLVELCKDMTPNPDPKMGSEIGVISQCTYKRVRSIDADLRNERIRAGTSSAIIESSSQVIPPVQWRRRPKYGSPHGDLPSRVIKTSLQRVIVYTKEIGVGIYDLSQEQFGAEADMTTVYSYIFRISSADDAAAANAAAQNAAQAPMQPPAAPAPVVAPTPVAAPAPIAEPVPSRADQFSRQESEDRVEALERNDHVERMERMAERMDRPPSSSHSRRRSGIDRPSSIASSAASRMSMGPDGMPKSPPPARDVPEAERLVRRSTDTRDNEQRSNESHAFMKSSPENEAEVRAAIASTLNPAAQTFVWRASDRRNAVDQPVQPSSPPSRSPVRELASPPSSATTSRQSLSGSISSRPSSMAPDEQMEKLKAVFARGSRVSLGGARTSSSPNMNRPLSEIDSQQVSPERSLHSSADRPKSEISG